MVDSAKAQTTRQMRQTRPVTRVRISDVASHLGLTKSTVSRALNGYPDIAEATRARVQKAVRDMGYRPMPGAQAIRTGRARALALVLELDAHDQFSPFLAEFLGGVTQAASAEGWSLTVASAAYGPQMRQVVDRLIDEQKADGFIIPRTRVSDDRIIHLGEKQVPCVLYGRTGADDDKTAQHSWYDIDGFDAFRRATLRLAEQGHTRIGFVGFDETFKFTHLREQGFKAGMDEAGLELDESLIWRGAMNTIGGWQATRDLLTTDTPPTALVMTTDEVALGAYEAASELGIEIGSDLSIIAYDGIPRGRLTRPRLTTYRVDNAAAGAALAGLLIRQLRGEDPRDLRDIAQATLQPGGSDGPPVLSSAQLASKISSNSGTF